MKKLLFGLFVAGVALSASAFTNADQKVSNFWFEVDPADSQTILNPNSPITPPSGACDAANLGPRCAVELTTSTAPSTVSQAQTNETYVSSAFNDAE